MNKFRKLTNNIKNMYCKKEILMKKVLKIIFSIIVILSIVLIGNLFSKNLFTEKAVAASNSGTTSDVQLLARAINGEARGEPYEGQVAVGAVILNRVKASNFPNTISGVIYQPGAFTAVADGQINVALEDESTVVKAARDALNGWDPTGGAIYYFNPDTATNKWIWSRPHIKTIGKHRFCK